MMKKIIYLITISISVLIFSCETKTDIGIGILPEDDILDANIIDTSSIEVYTLLMDSIATDNVNTLMLGEYIDPIFGHTKAGFVTQYGVLNYSDLTLEHIIEKAYFRITFDTLYLDHYGNENASHNIKVYRIDETLEDTTYYADNDPIQYETGTVVAEIDYVPNNNDKYVDVPLTTEFADEFLEIPSNMTDEQFKSSYKGFYFKTDVTGGDGAVMKCKINNETTLTIIAKKGTQDSDTFNVYANKSDNIRFNMFEHDYSSTTFYNQIDDEDTEQDSVAYIQSMGGLRTKIKFPFIDELKKLGDIVIYRAELVVKTAPSSITQEDDFPAIENMLIAGYDPDSEYYLLPEYYSSTGYYSVSYNDSSYKFDIAGYIRDILDGNIENNGLLLFAYSGSTNFGRSVITTGNHSDRMKLYITYAKL